MKILLIEDDAADARHIQEMLKAEPPGRFDVVTEPELRLGLAALGERTWDVLLLDLDLPDSQGLEALARAREAAADSLPVIVLTGVEDEALGAEAVRQGAQDYLAKRGLSAELLTRTLRYTVERQHAQMALLDAEERCREMAEGRRVSEEAQQRLATAIEQAAEAILITDVRGRIVYANPAFEKITGYSRQEAIGQNPRMLKSGRQDPVFYRRMWGSLIRGQAWHGRLVNKRKDGLLYEQDASITPVRDVTGQIINYVAVARDVSREALLEAELRQAQKMEAIGQLAGGLAHDFNNLLGIISGNAELLLLRRPGLGPEAVEGLNSVIRAAERGASLTRQLLIFSRKQTMQPQPVALNELVGNLLKMLKRTIPEDIRLECLYGEGLPLVQGDPGMLEQVLLNLVVNARDAMPRGGRLLIALDKASRDGESVRGNPEARAGEFVRLAVSDTGSGIAPEHLQRIFEPFFTTKEPGKGTGLGLAIVYGIVKQHQGWTEVYSRLGQGSTFKIYLPASLAAPGGVVPLAETRLRGGPETILLVEDDLSLRMITRRLLETFQYKVREATCASEALEVWRRHEREISLLLTDFVMPGGMSGRELGERLRGQRPGLKLVFMSGYSPEALGKDGEFSEGTRTYFLHKPCSPRTLLQTLRQCLDGD